ncbi:uncharacterized protein LOC135614604 [Musa acuminata AAA Group]
MEKKDRLCLDIIGNVLNYLDPKKAMSFCTMSTAWNTMILDHDPTKRVIPWLTFNKYFSWAMHNIVDDRKSFEVSVPGGYEKYEVEQIYHGWMVSFSESSKLLISLYNPFSRAKIYLPTCKESIFFGTTYLSSGLENPDSTLIITTKTTIFSWRKGDTSWTIEEKPNHDQWIITSLAGHFYALEEESTELISFQLFPLRITRLGVKILVTEEVQQHYLVESRGELWLVLEHCSFDIYVYRLDLECKAWVKMDCLGDRALLLDGYPDSLGISVPAHETGYESNYIYLIHDMEVLIMKYGCNKLISKTDVRKLGQHASNRIFWITPSSN